MSSAKHADNKLDDPLYVPTKKQWKKMSEYERSVVEERIICALEQESSLMGETTIHYQARTSATEVLRRYYGNQGKKVFIASDLHTLYPGERAFYPDLLVVFDVEDHHRRSWNVFKEKKGLDFALEIISVSSRRNDQVEKLNLFARIGIPEYFLFDPENFTLMGYELISHKGLLKYHKLPEKKPNHIFSKILGLELVVENYKLRFVSADGLEIPFGDELIHRLNKKLMGKDEVIADSLRQLEEEQKKIEEEQKKVEEEQKKVVQEQKKVEEEQKKVVQEQKKVEEEQKKVVQEQKKAEDEQKKAEKEKLRADNLEEELKELRLLLKKNKLS